MKATFVNGSGAAELWCFTAELQGTQVKKGGGRGGVEKNRDSKNEAEGTWRATDRAGGRKEKVLQIGERGLGGGEVGGGGT